MKNAFKSFILLSTLFLSSCSFFFLPGDGGTSSNEASGSKGGPLDSTQVSSEEFDDIFNRGGIFRIKDRYGIAQNFNYIDESIYDYYDSVLIDNGVIQRQINYSLGRDSDEYYVEDTLLFPNNDGTYKEYLQIHDVSNYSYPLRNASWTYDDTLKADYLMVGLHLDMFEYGTGSKEYELKEPITVNMELFGKMEEVRITSLYITFKGGKLSLIEGDMYHNRNYRILVNIQIFDFPEEIQIPEPNVYYYDLLYKFDSCTMSKNGKPYIEHEYVMDMEHKLRDSEIRLYQNKIYQTYMGYLDESGDMVVSYSRGQYVKKINEEGLFGCEFIKEVRRDNAYELEDISDEDSIFYELQNLSNVLIGHIPLKQYGDDVFLDVTYIKTSDKLSYFPLGDETEEYPANERPIWDTKYQIPMSKYSNPTLLSEPEHLDVDILNKGMEDAYIQLYYLDRFYFNLDFVGYDLDTRQPIKAASKYSGYIIEDESEQVFVLEHSDEIHDFHDYIYESLRFVDESTIAFDTEYDYAYRDGWISEKVTWLFHLDTVSEL